MNVRHEVPSSSSSTLSVLTRDREAREDHDAGAADGSEPWWKATWPLDLADARRLFVALLGVVGLYVLVGYLLSDWLAPNAITDLDEDWAQQLADGRSETGDELAHWGAFLAETHIKIGLSAVLVLGMLYRWRRWHEAVFVAVTLIFEASAYALSSIIVGRPRPDVERLVSSPVDSSFPSGHVAAATVYLAVVIVVFWHTRNVWARALATIVGLAIPVVVAIARMYQGMHFFSDVVAGSILGLISLWICLRVLGRPNDVAAAADHSARSRSMRLSPAPR